MHEELVFNNYKDKQKYYKDKSKEFKILHISNEIKIVNKGTKNEKTIVGKGITYFKKEIVRC